MDEVKHTPLPIYTTSTLTDWADKIDGRLGPISGADADALARLLRATANRIQQLVTDRNDHDLALRDAYSETARTADELAFWRYQAIWYCSVMLYGRPAPGQSLAFLENSRVWREAEKQLEAARVAENRERYAHAEAPRDPGAT